MRVHLGAWTTLLVVPLVCVASAQPQPAFEVADVRVSTPRSDGRPRLQMEGGTLRGGRYEIHYATMVDLIRTAYGVEVDAVIGGPAWISTDRFDVIAKPPEKSNAAPPLMLQSLLADRFGLAARRDTRPMPAWVLSRGPGEHRLKKASGTEESGCRSDYVLMRLTCRNATLDMLVAFLQAGPRTTMPVMNQTGIEGTWDFDVNDQNLAQTRGVSEDNPILEGVSRDLGLRLALTPVPQPAVVVERVNRAPTPNVPDLAKRMPPDPTEFEVASIRPCEFVNPMDTGGATGQRTSPSGQITTGCLSLTMLIAEAWDLGADTRAMGNVVMRATGPGVIAGAPRSLEGKYFNIVAKSPVPLGLGGPLFRDPKYQTMLRNLLIERFRMVTHYEGRVVDVSALVAPKPTFSRADPSSRSGCRSTGVAVGVPTTLTCRNVTMAQFVDVLNSEFLIVGGRGGRRFVDATGLQGTWDLTVRYRIRAAVAAEPGQAPEPTGDLPPLQALEQQLGLKIVGDKRPMPAFIIDRIDEKPTEN